MDTLFGVCMGGTGNWLPVAEGQEVLHACRYPPVAAQHWQPVASATREKTGKLQIRGGPIYPMVVLKSSSRHRRRHPGESRDPGLRSTETAGPMDPGFRRDDDLKNRDSEKEIGANIGKSSNPKH